MFSLKFSDCCHFCFIVNVVYNQKIEKNWIIRKISSIILLLYNKSLLTVTRHLNYGRVSVSLFNLYWYRKLYFTLHETDRITERSSNSQPIIINRELEMLAVTSIYTLKRCKKKCAPEDVYKLVQKWLG